MATTDNDTGSLVLKWLPAIVMVGALVWAAAKDWGRHDVSLAGISGRLDLQATHLVELQHELGKGDRENRDLTQRNADSVLHLTTRLEAYGEERSRILSGVEARLAHLDRRTDELQLEIRALREHMLTVTKRPIGSSP